MTPAEEARYERVAIMTAEGMSAEDAERYCDTKPHLYGYRVKDEIQDGLLLLP